MNKSIKTKIKALRNTVAKRLEPNRRGRPPLYFDPDTTLDYFQSFSVWAEDLKKKNPLFNDLVVRKIPTPIKGTDNEGRGYITDYQLKLLLSDMNYCLEVLGDNSEKSSNSDSALSMFIERKSLLSLLKNLSFKEWGYVFGGVSALVALGMNIQRIKDFIVPKDRPNVSVQLENSNQSTISSSINNQNLLPTVFKAETNGQIYIGPNSTINMNTSTKESSLKK